MTTTTFLEYKAASILHHDYVNKYSTVNKTGKYLLLNYRTNEIIFVDKFDLSCDNKKFTVYSNNHSVITYFCNWAIRCNEYTEKNQKDAVSHVTFKIYEISDRDIKELAEYLYLVVEFGHPLSMFFDCTISEINENSCTIKFNDILNYK